MKRLLFLISICLLSQNITISAQAVGSGYRGAAPVPETTNPNTAVTAAVVQSAPVPSVSSNPPVFEKSISSAKIPIPVPQEQTVSQEGINVNSYIDSAINSYISSNIEKPKIDLPGLKQPPVIQQDTSENMPEKAEKKTEIQKPAVPLLNASSKRAENEQKISKTNTVKSVPVPKSLEQVRQEYTQTIADEQKYKFYEDEKLQEAINPVPVPTGVKKLNMWAQYKQKQSGKPPIIVEKNLSNPADSNELRAKIIKVEFPESKIFTPDELQQLAAPLLSQPVTINDIKKVVNGITRCYILGDYVTSKAYLPPQDLSDGVLKIGLMEGTVGNVKVEGNRWTRTSYIKNRIDPKEGEVLRLSDIEKDVIKFNNNNTAKIKVGLNAGEEQGETDITLNTEEPFPFRIAFMSDNQGRQAVGVARYGALLSADSLFGFRDRLSLGGYLGRGNRVGFADYNIPIGKYGTRLGASVSAGNISVVNGPMRAFGVGGTSQVYSVYATHPWFDRQDANISSYTAANIRRSTSDIAGFEFYDKSTFSLTQGFTARKDTEKGIWFTGHYGSVGFKGLGGDTDFFKYEGNITRLHDFGKGIIGQFRLSGQYSPNDDLPWMEQFQIGGLSTVRGYSEGLLLGKSGYFASAEVITPLPFLPKRIGSDRLGYIYPREMIKGAVFMDNGMIFPYKANGAGIDSGELLMSWGLGLRVNISQDLAARFYWGFGLNNKYEMDQKMGRFHFEVTCAPDIGRVVASRKPRKKDNKENL